MVAIRGAGWGLAPCLVDLFEEADERKPDRSTAADGSIGDPAHAARGTASDHNPADGWVTAADLDDDGDSEELGVRLLKAHLIATRDDRVKYLIHEGTIVKAYENRGLPAWTPQPYTGVNAHAKHLHVSVWNTDAARNNTDPWWPTEEDDAMNDADRKWIAAQFDAHRKWVRSELGTEQGKSLYEKVRGNLDTVRDGLAKLIRGDG